MAKTITARRRHDPETDRLKITWKREESSFFKRKNVTYTGLEAHKTMRTDRSTFFAKNKNRFAQRAQSGMIRFSDQRFPEWTTFF